jgi:hypothetical protein
MIRGQIAWARAPTILLAASFAHGFAEDESDQDFTHAILNAQAW